MSAPTISVSEHDLQEALDTFDTLHLDWIDLADIIHDAVSSDYAPIRSAGVEAQLTYLIRRWGVEDVDTVLRDFAAAG